MLTLNWESEGPAVSCLPIVQDFVPMLVLAFVLLGGIGCAKEPEDVRRSEMNDKIDCCVSAITNKCKWRRGEYENALRKIVVELKCVTNVADREWFANRLSEGVLQSELSFKECECAAELERRVNRYIQCAGAASTALRETIGEERWLDFFVKAGAKLKQACFSVSCENRGKGESEIEYRRRKSVALNLYHTYECEVNLWGLYKRVGAKALLSPKIRADFIRQTRELFDYPNRDELFRLNDGSVQ